jgi:hypothetical protein
MEMLKHANAMTGKLQLITLSSGVEVQPHGRRTAEPQPKQYPRSDLCPCRSPEG